MLDYKVLKISPVICIILLSSQVLDIIYAIIHKISKGATMELLIFLVVVFVILVYVMSSSAANIMMIMKYGKDWRDGSDE